MYTSMSIILDRSTLYRRHRHELCSQYGSILWKHFSWFYQVQKSTRYFVAISAVRWPGSATCRGHMIRFDRNRRFNFQVQHSTFRSGFWLTFRSQYICFQFHEIKFHIWVIACSRCRCNIRHIDDTWQGLFTQHQHTVLLGLQYSLYHIHICVVLSQCSLSKSGLHNISLLGWGQRGAVTIVTSTTKHSHLLYATGHERHNGGHSRDTPVQLYSVLSGISMSNINIAPLLILATRIYLPIDIRLQMPLKPTNQTLIF